MSDRYDQEWLSQLGKEPPPIPSLSPGEKHHVFIAYSDDEKDIEFAEKIYHTLKHLGFKVFFYHADTIFGSDTVNTVSDALQSSRRVIALLTRSAVGRGGNSGDVEFKFNLAAACCRMILEGRVLTIPVLKDTTERDIPLTAKYGNYVEVRHKKTWFKELCTLLTADGVFLGDVCPITNIGEGAAWSYIDGYLKVIYSYVKDHIRSWCHKTSDKMPYAIPFNQVSFKLHAVIPESGRIPATFQEADAHVVDVEGLTVVTRDHAGDVGRKYTTTMHEIKDSDGKSYYFMGEFAGIVKSMHETMQSGLTTLNTSNFGQQVIKFSNTLELLSNFTQTKPVADALEITRYIDQGENEENLSQLLLGKIKAEIKARTGEEDMEH